MLHITESGLGVLRRKGRRMGKKKTIKEDEKYRRMQCSSMITNP